MSERGTVYLSIDCFCTPPKRLTTDAEHFSDRCDVCGAEVMTGAIQTGPRLQIVRDEPEHP